MHSGRLVIRRFNQEDWKDLSEYMGDTYVVHYEPYEAFTKEDCIKEAEERSKDTSPYYAVCLKETNKLIGHIDNPEFNKWSVGYVFNPKYYGKGYATESVRRIIQHAFEERNAHRVVAYTCVHNCKSWEVLERIGMRREAHMLQNVFFKRTEDGSPIWNDSYQYAFLKREWVMNYEIL